MRYLKKYENYSNNTYLIVCDVQKSFKKFFTDMYLNELNKYCKSFQNVYQIWDNHSDGKNPDKDYLYDKSPDIENTSDLYQFPNQKDLIEKRYTHDVDVDFFKKILDKKVYDDLKKKEKSLVKGNYFVTKENTIIVYVANKHAWFHVPIKLYQLFTKLKGQSVTIVGGADGECLEDIVTTGIALGVDIKRDHKFIYSANHCPIK
jgi:hypothetical protein